MMMWYIFQSVNPRWTDSIFALLTPTGVNNLIYSSGGLIAVSLIYFLTSLIIDLLNNQFKKNGQKRLKTIKRLLLINLISIFNFPLQLIGFLLITTDFVKILKERSSKAVIIIQKKEKEEISKGIKIVTLIELIFNFLIGIILFLFITIGIPVAGYFLIRFGYKIGYTFIIIGLSYWLIFILLLPAVKERIIKLIKISAESGKILEKKTSKIIIRTVFIIIPLISLGIFLNSGIIRIHTPAPENPTGTSITDLKVMTYNVRNSMADDGSDSWQYRKQFFVNYVETINPDILGLQEACIDQITYIAENLENRNYKWTGFGRDDGIHGGEHTPILYDSDKIEYIDGDTFWYNDNPDMPGKSFQDTYNCFRVTTWARFKYKSNDAQFVVYCTHYGFGDYFRSKAGPLLLEKVEEYSGGLPVIVMGDFNLNSTAYGFDLINGTGNKPIYDSYSLANGPGPHLVDTFNSFEIGYSYKKNKIDFIFVSDGINVLSSEVPQDTYEAEGISHYYSDHFPVVSTMQF